MKTLLVLISVLMLTSIGFSQQYRIDDNVVVALRVTNSIDTTSKYFSTIYDGISPDLRPILGQVPDSIAFCWYASDSVKCFVKYKVKYNNFTANTTVLDTITTTSTAQDSSRFLTRTVFNNHDRVAVEIVGATGNKLAAANTLYLRISRWFKK